MVHMYVNLSNWHVKNQDGLKVSQVVRSAVIEPIQDLWCPPGPLSSKGYAFVIANPWPLAEHGHLSLETWILCPQIITWNIESEKTK